jgi:hypothetical protein
MSDLERYLEEVRDLPCAPLLQVLCEQVRDLDAGSSCEIGAFGVRFRIGESVLCEFSVFGALFIARVGPDQAVDYRVRDAATAAAALDHIVRVHAVARASAGTPA